MMRSSRSFRALSVLVVALAGVVLVVGISPGATRFLTKKKALKLFYKKSQADARFLEPGEMQTRSTSCASYGFYPITENIMYDTDDGVIRVGDGVYPLVCDLSLPDGATVTAVHFTVHDDSVWQVSTCLVQRQSLTTTGEAFNNMAGPLGTSGPEAPGIVRLTDTSIDFPTVDNASFAYWATCRVSPTFAVGIVGVSVEYTISAADG